MIETSEAIAYSIAYVGISYANRAAAAGLEVAALQNRDGSFVGPTSDTTLGDVGAAAHALPADGRESLVFRPGTNAYPLIKFEQRDR
jgi:phosphate transport system substrate-binding protein